MNRLTTSYEPAIGLIQMLANGKDLSLEDGESIVSLPGFLFDMNRLFQAVLSRFLADYLVGYSVLDEYRLRRVFAYVSDHNPQRRSSPIPRPDLAILQDRVVVAILDAKYIDLWGSAPDRDILYQLAIYALSQQRPRATVLYPTLDPLARDQRIEVLNPIDGGRRAEVILRPVNLGLLAEYAAGSGTAEDAAMFAMSLAFGSS
jgi:5-methylcytosine-specific restriction enzyme subunit McrC